MTSEIDKDALSNVLSKTLIFHHLKPEIIRLIAEKMKIISCKTGQLIIKKGDPGASMYVILEGRVKVHDQEHIIAEMVDLDFFGELSLFDSEPRSMSVSAEKPCVIGEIEQNDFIRIMQEFPGIVTDIIKVLTRRLRSQNRLLITEYEAREKELKKLVAQRTAELGNKNEELTQAMGNLERSQAQLIQQAKLASIGQLTAGIAHEIQNPLNFVNNFSELSEELIDEIKNARSEEDKNAFLNELRENLKKINKHGKRADSIVKSMLDHSRTSSGEKRLTDINALCEEFFNLAYQGMRANNRDFNCILEKHFDKDLPKVNVVAPDISRVLLNLFNNAFYAVHEKSKSKSNYQPEVIVSTQSSGPEIFIRVKDNGGGVPSLIKEKIFEPFFTTKIAGEGTGLGLSLSYDIITKDHNGKLTVESEQGKFTQFTIQIPV